MQQQQVCDTFDLFYPQTPHMVAKYHTQRHSLFFVFGCVGDLAIAAAAAATEQQQ